jgi:triphosphoribosyl-dephospho-CoA synthase
MAIMTSLSDTCVLSRRNGRPQRDADRRARRAAWRQRHGSGRKALAGLDAQMLALNASPGGAADLLAATLFLDRVSQPASCSF